jgi:hypothetical protein
MPATPRPASRQIFGLARTGLAADDHHLVFLYRLQYLRAALRHRQVRRVFGLRLLPQAAVLPQQRDGNLLLQRGQSAVDGFAFHQPALQAMQLAPQLRALAQPAVREMLFHRFEIGGVFCHTGAVIGPGILTLLKIGNP